MQDRVFWTDLEEEAIYSVNRLTGHDVAKVAEDLNNPLDLVVFHEQRQPKGNKRFPFMALVRPSLSQFDNSWQQATGDM